jgi:hypothetical protein
VRLTIKHVFKELVLLFNVSTNPFTHTARSEEVGTTNPRSLTPILIGRPNTTAGSSDLAGPPCELAGLINEDVIVENEVRIAIDHEAPGRYLCSGCSHSIDLREKNRGIKNYTCSKETLHVRTEDSTGKEAQCRLNPINHDSMSRVISPLKANYPVSSLRKNVDDLTLTLITPLGAHDHDA